MLMYAKTFREADMGKKSVSRTAKRNTWQGHIAGWKASGLSQRQYCEREGLATQTFGYWQRKFKKEGCHKPRFYPLTVPAPCMEPKREPADSGLQVILCEQRFRVSIDRNFDSQTLGDLIATLEAIS